MFEMRNRHDWTFQQFAIVLLQTMLIYMVAGLIFPDFFGEAIVDLKENFYAHRRWFFSRVSDHRRKRVQNGGAR